MYELCSFGKYFHMYKSERKITEGMYGVKTFASIHSALKAFPEISRLEISDKSVLVLSVPLNFKKR